MFAAEEMKNKKVPKLDVKIFTANLHWVQLSISNYGQSGIGRFYQSKTYTQNIQ